MNIGNIVRPYTIPKIPTFKVLEFTIKIRLGTLYTAFTLLAYERKGQRLCSSARGYFPKNFWLYPPPWAYLITGHSNQAGYTLPYNRVITPGRMQKNRGFETEIAQWAHTRQFFLWISTHFYSIFQVFCVYWPSGRIHAVGVITRLYGRWLEMTQN